MYSISVVCCWVKAQVLSKDESQCLQPLVSRGSKITFRDRINGGHVIVVVYFYSIQKNKYNVKYLWVALS